MPLSRTRKFKKILYSPLIIIILIILVVVSIRATWNMYNKYSDTKTNLEQVRSEHQQVVARKQELTNKLEDLNTATGRARELRTTYGVAKAGEGMIVIVDNKDSQNTDNSQNKPSLWQRIKNIFD
jgi:uncharacterized protein YpmB